MRQVGDAPVQQTTEVEPVEIVTHFVTGALPSYTFRLLLSEHQPLQEHLAAGDAPTYPDGSLLVHLMGLDWQSPEDVLAAQQILLRLLRDQGREVEPTDRYRRWAALVEEQFTLRARVQPIWLNMPAAYFATLLDEFSDISGATLENVLRREIRRRFRYQERPPRWLHDEIWPVNADGPLTFVEQIDMSSGEHESFGYVFRDEPADDHLMLVQSTWIAPAPTRREPAGPAAPRETSVPDPRTSSDEVPIDAPVPQEPDQAVPAETSVSRPVAWAPVPAAPPSLPPAVSIAAEQDDDVEATVVVDRSVRGQWSLVLDDGRTFDLWSTSVVVGRRPGTGSHGAQTLAIPDEALTMSKTHARLDLVDGTWQITDLGSTNGVLVAAADGRDTEVPRGGAAPVYGYLELGAVGARIVPTSQVVEMVPSASGDHEGAADAHPTTEKQTMTEGAPMTERREMEAVRRFVAGDLPLGLFIHLLHRDLPLRELLVSGGGLEAYAQADLLGHLIRARWQEPAGVLEAQRILERFLQAHGVDVNPTDMYERRASFHENLQPLLSQVQPPWLKIPAPYVALLLRECGNQADGDVEDLMRQQITSRFRYLAHPPRWLYEECWPVFRNAPLVFVEQIDLSPDRPGTAVSYVFVDPRNGAYLVLPQTLPVPDAAPAPPAQAAVQHPQGVLTVLARPGAFWLTRPTVGRGSAIDAQLSGREGDEPGSDGPTVAEPDVPAQAAPAPAPDPVPVPVAPEGALSPPPVQDVWDALAQSSPPADTSPLADTSSPVAVQPEEDDLESTVMLDWSPFEPWTLVLDDGRSFPVTARSVVVGRRPETDDLGVQALAITDKKRSLSKTHARLDLVDGVWHATDLGSTNGVVVVTVDGQETKVEPGQPTPVHARVELGSVKVRLEPGRAD